MYNSGTSRREIAESYFAIRRRHCEERSDEAIHSFFARQDGLLRGACHRARIRATRWLAMTACLGCLKIESSCVAVPAKAGTHNHRRLLEQKPSATVPKARPRRMGPRVRGDDDCFAQPVIGRAFARPVGDAPQDAGDGLSMPRHSKSFFLGCLKIESGPCTSASYSALLTSLMRGSAASIRLR